MKKALTVLFTLVAFAGFATEAAQAQVKAAKKHTHKGVLALASYPARHPKKSESFTKKQIKKAPRKIAGLVKKALIG